MAITDELREYIGLGDGAVQCAIRAIADRIDREHRMAMEKVAAEADAMPMTDESMAEHGWVRLPVDEDGVTIRIGDRLSGYNKTIEVVELRYGRSGWVIISSNGNGYADTFAFEHVRTVEDVLRKFACEIDADAYGITDAKVAEFAAKLRLAEGVDE